MRDQRSTWRSLFGAACLAIFPACDSREGDTSPTSPNDATATPQADWLVDVTKPAGIDFVHDRHNTGEFRFPEMEGSGVGVLDYDNDGFYDLYFAQGGKMPNVEGGRELSDQLYRNRGDGTFENVTERAKIHATGYGMGVTCGDYNNDSFVDIFIANVGANTLLKNNGDGTFTDVTEKLDVGDKRWGLGAAFLDYDNDGWLDLAVTNYVLWDPEHEIVCNIRDTGNRDYCGPSSHEGDRDIFYHNQGGKLFEDVSKSSAIGTKPGPGMGLVAADFNNDQRLDLYVANDTEPNRLWIQQPDHTFVDQAGTMLCDVNENGKAEASMGVVIEDFDRNGLPDLLMTHFRDESNTLFLNQGDMFIDVTRRARLHTPSLRYTAFGINTLDLFNDGRLFVYIVNGKVNMTGKNSAAEAHPYAEPDQLLEWDFDALAFDDVSAKAGEAMQVAEIGRGSATLDYDNDGDLDLVMTNNAGPARLLRNDAADGHHWIQVRCLTTDQKRDEYNARVEIRIGDITRTRQVTVAESYGSSRDPRVHFGLGKADHVDRLTVYWLDGTTRSWDNVPADALFIAKRDAATH